MKVITFMTDSRLKQAVKLLKNTTVLFLGLFIENEPDEEGKDTSFYLAGHHRFSIVVNRIYFEIILKELLKITWFREIVPFNMDFFFKDFVKIDKNEPEENQLKLFDDDGDKYRTSALKLFQTDTVKLQNTRHLEELRESPAFDEIICYFNRADKDIPVAINNDYVRFCIQLFSLLEDEDIEFRQAEYSEMGHIIVNERVLIQPTFKRDEQ